MGVTAHTVNTMQMLASEKHPNKRPLKVLYRAFIFNFVANLVSVQHQRKMQFVIKGCGRKHDLCRQSYLYSL